MDTVQWHIFINTAGTRCPQCPIAHVHPLGEQIFIHTPVLKITLHF
jgi:hypothetical protein